MSSSEDALQHDVEDAHDGIEGRLLPGFVFIVSPEGRRWRGEYVHMMFERRVQMWACLSGSWDEMRGEQAWLDTGAELLVLERYALSAPEN